MRRPPPPALLHVIALAPVLAALAPPPARAATLPAHDPLAVLVIGDEVNPHGLTDAELTQPADIKAALEAPDSGLRLAGGVATLVDSDCIDDALAALAATPRPDVVVYFAHRAATACASGDRQPALTAALEGFLQDGGGVVVLHHGLFSAMGKDPILTLLGGRANTVAWDTTTGQRVFDVAPGHFITATGARYDGTAPLAGSGAVPGGTFSYFDNVPDERYPAVDLIPAPGERREILFASDSGGTRVLGYTLERPGWAGRVVWYQPGEYQPRALDDRAGVNFQIFASSILYAARREPAAMPGGDDVSVPSGGGGCCRAAAGDAAGSPLGALAMAVVVAWRGGRRRVRRVLAGRRRLQ